MLAAVFCFKLPEISTSPIFLDLMRSFKVEVPAWSVCPPTCDLELILWYDTPSSSSFELLSSLSLRSLLKKVSVLGFIGHYKEGELQALSTQVSFSFSGACIAYVPEFVAKTESAVHPLPRSFIIRYLSDFAAGFDQELLLCTVQTLREYLNLPASFVNRPQRLFDI